MMTIDRRFFLGGVAATIVPLSARAEQPSPPERPTVLEAGHGSVALDGKTKTDVWAYDGQLPGPLLRVTKGKSVAVRLVNRLDQPTSLCWHGVRIVNAMDGVAGLTQPPVAPGGSFDYRFTPPDAGLYWYHPHVWPVSAEQIGRGLYGVLIVDEPDPPEVDQDLLVVLDDWSLDAKGQFAGAFLSTDQALHAGRVGALLTVNAKPVPVASDVVPGARLRLRLLNACSARIALIGFVGMRVNVIAIDGQPSELFQPARGMVPIGPGSRFEVMVDLPAEADKQASLVLRGDGEPDRSLIVFTTKGKATASRSPVEKLPENSLLPTRIPLERSQRHTLTFGGGAPAVSAAGVTTAPGTLLRLWTINGEASDGVGVKPLFTVKRGGVVTLTFVNKTAFPQQMHIHGHVWRLLHDLDDGWDPYWRDSVLLAPGRSKHVAFIADNPGKWAIESLMLERQVTGLATWFLVT